MKPTKSKTTLILYIVQIINKRVKFNCSSYSSCTSKKKKIEEVKVVLFIIELQAQ